VSEFRQDRTTGAWVIIAPERSQRPRRGRRCDATTAPAPGFDPSCPFCPGNERLLPGIIEETASEAPPGWRVRVVPNKYPALHPGNVLERRCRDGALVVPGYGYHEVVIETGHHDADLAWLSDSDLHAIVRAYRHRYVELKTRPGIKAVVVFRNHGRRAGASLPHPHSQVIATAITPPRLAAMAGWARAHHARRGRCVVCEELARELEAGRRIVEAADHHLVVVPFAPAGPFEQQILPRRHQASFAQSDDDELDELGRLLQRALRRLAATLDDPPYNFAIESGAAEASDARSSHWRLRIVPDVVRPGGFELGAGLPINPSRPEDDAEMLRRAGAGEPGGGR